MPRQPINLATVYKKSLYKMQTGYQHLINEVARNRYQPLSTSAYADFTRALETTMRIADVLAANRLRWRSLRQRLEAPDISKTVTVPQIVHANPWLRWHAGITWPLIHARAEGIVKLEADFLNLKAAELVKRPVDMKLYRLEMHYRGAVGDVYQIAEQVQLSDPEVGAAFPFAVYQSRHDKRARPTHYAMHDFVAVRSWDGWPKCRPRTGHNCRCGVRYLHRTEADRLGYLTAAGKPKFQVRWPSAEARRNFESGLFPDPGFEQPRYWAGAA